MCGSDGSAHYRPASQPTEGSPPRSELLDAFRRVLPQCKGMPPSFNPSPSLPVSTETTMGEVFHHISQVAYAGPKLPSTGPGSDQREPERARLSNGSSEASPPSPVLAGSELKAEDLRVGGPRLCRLPSEVFALSSEDDKALVDVLESTLCARIHQAIETAGIELSALEAVKQRWRHSTNPPEPTVIITSQQTEPNNDAWLLLCQQIRQLCVEEGQDNLNVEVRQPKATEPMLSYPVADGEEIVYSWSWELKDDILKTLTGHPWLSLDVLRRGRESEANWVTIMVMIPEDATTSRGIWNRIRDQIVTLLDRAGLDDVAVEIYRGALCPYTKHGRVLLSSEDWKTEASFGGSLAPLGDRDRTGTIGGFVTVRFEGEPGKAYGLSCFHCVANSNDNDNPHRRWREKGIFPNDPENTIELAHPSCRDLLDTIEHHQEEIETLQADKLRQMAEPPTDQDAPIAPSRPSRLDMIDKAIAVLQQAKVDAENFMASDGHYFGKVFAASGLRVDRWGTTLDWALVDVEERRISTNKVPKQALEKYKTELERLQPDRCVTGTNWVFEGRPVYKLGRTTGFTRGMVNAIKTSRLLSSSVDPATGKVTQKCREDWAVVSGSTDEFTRPGDSGALVLDHHGNCVAMVTGGDLECTRTYITPIYEVFKDIQHITGALDVGLLRDR